MTVRPTTALPEWGRLGDLAVELIKRPLSDIVGTRGRFDALSLRCADLFIDFSKQRIDDRVLAAFQALGRAIDLPGALTNLMSGAIVNPSERRPALHTALRAPYAQRPIAVRDVVERESGRIADFVEKVRDGRWRGFSGRAIRDVVHIGIGGSHLGPELVVEALVHYRSPTLKFRFLANVDGSALDAALEGLHPETTLFIVASKSFGTMETRINATSIRSWFLERTGRLDAIPRHFVAISANVEAARAFGMPADNVFAMWDWVGGRYSLWSAVGLPIAIAIGWEEFVNLLEGANEVDRHALTTPLARNAPALLALIGVWNYNMLGAQSHAVLAYDRRLRLLPPYLQQLEMESNGKSTRSDGTAVDVQTMPALWGGEETNGQHAFHQQLHQGNRSFSADFIACINPGRRHGDHHQWLLANYLAQSEALLLGRRAGDADTALAAQRSMPGNRPSTSILLDDLSPRSLGALLALYEHKTFCQGMIWQINPFDQWGVELGKVLSESIHTELGSGSSTRHDPSTTGLIQRIRSASQRGEER
jgi:glucose-6-phosphate isomerase